MERMTSHYECQCAKRLRHFTEVICIKGGTGFIEGDIYAMGEATNNGLYVLSCDDKGDPVTFMVHNYTDYLGSANSDDEDIRFEIIA